METTAAAFGQKFSALNVTYDTRMTLFNNLIAAMSSLQQALGKEHEAEMLAMDNPALQGEGEWDEFRGNGVGTNPAGINVSVQTAAESLFTAMDAI